MFISFLGLRFSTYVEKTVLSSQILTITFSNLSLGCGLFSAIGYNIWICLHVYRLMHMFAVRCAYLWLFYVFVSLVALWTCLPLFSVCGHRLMSERV